MRSYTCSHATGVAPASNPGNLHGDSTSHRRTAAETPDQQVTILFALTEAADIALMAHQVVRAEKTDAPDDLAGPFELVAVGILLPGFLTALFAYTQAGLGFWATAFAWIPCAVAAIEFAAWGRPHLLGRWPEAAMPISADNAQGAADMFCARRT